MPRRIHKTEYHHLEMPFMFDMVCKNKKPYNINILFLYKYPAKGGERPSVLALNPKARRLHFFMTRLFLKYLEEEDKSDFPIEWDENFSPHSKYLHHREYPYAPDNELKRYISSTLASVFSHYLKEQKGIEMERVDYLFADLNFVSFNFMIQNCTPLKPLKIKSYNKVRYVYPLYDDINERS